MYVEQELQAISRQVLETLLMQKIVCGDGLSWTLGPNSFCVIGFSNSQMQRSTIIITKEYGISTVHVPSISNMKLEPNDGRSFHCHIPTVMFVD